MGRKKGMSKGEKRKPAKGRRMERSSTSSSSSSGGDESASSSGGDRRRARTTSSEDSDSSSPDEGRLARRRRKKKGGGMWELVNEMWAYEARPRLLQNRRTVEKMTIAEVSQFKAHYEKEEEKKGGGSAVFGRDRKLKAQRFKEGKDNGTSKLHPARFELRMPLAVPKKYWDKIPARRDVFRHFPLAHLGMEGQVSEMTVVRMHDRRVPISLDMLYKGNVGRDAKADKAEWLAPTEVRHLQEAILNYAVLLNALWPLDYAGFVIMRVLVEANWGLAAGASEKARVSLVRRFFDDTVRENSGRAVRDETPLTYEEAKAKWVKVLEGMFPELTIMGMGAMAQAAGGSGGGGKQLGQAKGQGQPQKKADGGDAQRGRGKPGRGGGAGGSGAVAPTGAQRAGAVASGLPVCYRFNQAEGCTRDAANANACKDVKGVHFAHACNWLDKATGKFCLQLHARFSNH